MAESTSFFGAAEIAGLTGPLLLLYYTAIFLAAVVSALVSQAKNRGPHPLFWFALGLVLPFVGLVLICCLPNRSERLDVRKLMAQRFRNGPASPPDSR